MPVSSHGFLKFIALCVLGYKVKGHWAWERGHDSYELVNIYDGSNFFDEFRFYTDDDPTHGYVQYVDANTAQASGFARAVNNSQVYLGVDNSTVLNVSSSATTGRRSVRLESLHTFDQGILITDFAHVPSGVCGAWPAYWTYDYAENPYGEVDIIEGVNDQVGDDISLHTSAQCQLTDDSTSQSGTDVRTDCSLKTNYVDGCGVSGPSNSYGDPFNGQGGGVWALFLRQDELAIWMFPRNGIPDEISSGGQLTLDKWGVPLLHFASSSGCRVSEQWKNQTIVSSPSQGLKFTNSPPGLLHEQIFDIDFCGENAGGTNWNESSTSASQSCADSTGFPTCAAYVAANPRAFSNSYFLVNSVKVYQSREATVDDFSGKGAASARRPSLLLLMGWLFVTELFSAHLT